MWRKCSDTPAECDHRRDAPGVVDVLEPVDVEEQRDRRPRTGLEQALQVLGDGGAIEQSGETVVRGLVQKKGVCLRRLPLGGDFRGDVPEMHDQCAGIGRRGHLDRHSGRVQRVHPGLLLPAGGEDLAAQRVEVAAARFGKNLGDDTAE